MPDVPYPKPKPPTRGEQAGKRLADALALVRVTLTGRAGKPIRRPLLFVIAAGSVGIAMTVDSVVPSVVALISIMLLALTDEVPL